MRWRKIIPALTARPPIVVDDAPWHQAAGGSLIFNAVLRNGGTLYIDRFGASNQQKAENETMETPSPSIHFTESMPLNGLIGRLEENVMLRKAFFRNLDLIWVVNGTITEEVKERLQVLAREQTEFNIPILASFSGTGTATINTTLYFDTETPGNIGLPLPGTMIKMVRFGSQEDDNWGIHIKTAGLNPAIWQNGALIEAETELEGFYAVYDTIRLIDPIRPFKGIQTRQPNGRHCRSVMISMST